MKYIAKNSIIVPFAAFMLITFIVAGEVDANSISGFVRYTIINGVLIFGMWGVGYFSGIQKSKESE